jgi:hypothetical protein
VPNDNSSSGLNDGEEESPVEDVVEAVMIKKTAKGYVLHSKDGSRKLGGPYRTREEALKRERQVQFFKHAKKPAR